VSVVEYNVLSEKPPATHQVSENGNRAHAEQKTHERDIFKRIRSKDVCRLTRQLATLLRAGLPLVPALSALVEQLQGDPLAQTMEEVRGSVNSGSTLSYALSKHPSVFSRLFVNMVAAAEASGTLEEVLLRLAEMLAKRMHLTSKVKAAIAYPIMMVVVATAVVTFLLSVVVPSITQIFLEMNRVLPWPTRLLIATSAFVERYLLLIAIVVCAIFFAIATGYRTKEGRLFADRSKLKLPIFGKLFLKLEIARMARTLGVLLTSGIPILGALEIAKGVMKNSFMAGSLDSMKDLVSKGDTIANSIRKTGLFPPIVFHIIATGQISGNIEAGFMNIADMFDDEVQASAKTLVSLLEPAILLLMGVVVGFIVLAILLPIFEINQAL